MAEADSIRSHYNIFMPASARLRRAAAVLVTILAAAPGSIADVKPLTLYQRAGRSPWLILGEVQSVDKRFVEVKVLEVLKGAYARDAFRIIYKLENFLRKNFEDRMEFKKGERALFFLKRYESDRPDGKLDDWMKEEDLFAEAFGAQGKFPVPEEGGSDYLDAIREFVRVSAIADPEAQGTAILKFLESPNPHILEAGLERTIEERLAGPGQVELLLRLSDDPRDPVRLDALQVLGEVAEDLRASGRKLQNHEDIVNVLKGKAIGDGGDLYRVEALKVVFLLAGPEEKPFLLRLSKEDRSQLVRYEAGRSLLALAGP
jgi:hypothetical protein